MSQFSHILITLDLHNFKIFVLIRKQIHVFYIQECFQNSNAILKNIVLFTSRNQPLCENNSNFRCANPERIT